jgi:hypothetical protein
MEDSFDEVWVGGLDVLCLLQWSITAWELYV